MAPREQPPSPPNSSAPVQSPSRLRSIGSKIKGFARSVSPGGRKSDDKRPPGQATPRSSPPACPSIPAPGPSTQNRAHDHQGPNLNLPTAAMSSPFTPQIDVSPPSPTVEASSTPLLPSLPVATSPRPMKPQKAYKSSGDTKKDIIILQTIYALHDNPDFRNLVLSVVHIKEGDKDGKFHQAFKLCVDFTDRLAPFVDSHPADGASVMTAFQSAIAEASSASGGEGEAPEVIVEKAITEIQGKYPLLAGDANKKTSRVPFKVVDVALGVTLTALEVFQGASEWIPVGMAKPLVAGAAILLKAVEQTRTNMGDMRRIAETAGKFVVSLAVDCSTWTEEPKPQFRKALDELEETFTQVVRVCDKLSRRPFVQRFVLQGTDKNEIADIKDELDTAIKHFTTRTQINIHFDLQAIGQKIDDAALNRLPEHNVSPPNTYLVDSREDVIEEIGDWVEDPDKSVFWLRGAAGLGKSTIAGEVIRRLQREDRLASYVFLRNTPGNNPAPAKVIQILSRRLGTLRLESVPSIAKATGVCRDVIAQPLEQFFTMYITKPVQALGYPRPLVIVVDALDEWDPEHCQEFLECLTRLPSPLPVKFIMTSRPIHHIKHAFSQLSTKQHPLADAPRDVIRCYFDDRMTNPKCSKPIRWSGMRPSKEDIERLVELADGSLIWAATVCALLLPLEERAPYDILREILAIKERVTTQEDSPLRILYQDAIVRLFPKPAAQGVLRDFLGRIIVLQEPLPIDGFGRFVSYDVGRVQQTLTALQTRGELERPSVPPATQLFHASFLEFMHGDVFPPTIRVVDQDSHYRMAESCIKVITFRTTQASGDQSCIHSGLGDAGRYAVRFFATHLSGASQHDSSALLTSIEPGELLTWAALIAPCSSWESWESMEPELLVTTRTCSLQELDPGLDKAALAYKTVTDLLPANHPALSDLKFVNTLARTLFSCFEWRGSMKNLDKAISWYQKGLDLLDMAHPDRPEQLRALAHAIQRRSEHQSSIAITDEDLDSPVSLLLEAIGSPSYRRNSSSLNQLAGALLFRFRHQHSMADLEEAGRLSREAVDMESSSPLHRRFSLHRLALVFQHQFEQTGLSEDITTAITLHREALDICRKDLDERYLPRTLYLLANVLQSRYERDGSLDDLNESISSLENALDLLRTPHPNQAELYRSLSAALQARFEKRGSHGDLSKATDMRFMFFQHVNGLTTQKTTVSSSIQLPAR